MNFRQIEAFRAVMVTGSATAAAKLLFITQPAISRLIADLELATKLKLFVRKPNRLEATPEAQALYREVDRAFIGLEQVSRCADAIANQQEGSLRMVAMPVCLDSFLPSLIAEFSKTHPNISIELESAPQIQALDLVRSQRLDLGIVALTHHGDVGLQIQKFCHQQAVCVVPAGHPLAHKPVIHAQDLQHEAFISLPLGSPFRTRCDEIFAQAKIPRRFAIETRSQHAIYELVRRGAGVAIVDPFVTDSQDTDIAIRPFVPQIGWDYAVVQPLSTSPSLITQSFVTMLMAQFS
jgi:DNA-binding transcriptional LysR family regulator